MPIVLVEDDGPDEVTVVAVVRLEVEGVERKLAMVVLEAASRAEVDCVEVTGWAIRRRACLA